MFRNLLVLVWLAISLPAVAQELWKSEHPFGESQTLMVYEVRSLVGKHWGRLMITQGETMLAEISLQLDGPVQSVVVLPEGVVLLNTRRLKDHVLMQSVFRFDGNDLLPVGYFARPEKRF